MNDVMPKYTPSLKYSSAKLQGGDTSSMDARHKYKTSEVKLAFSQRVISLSFSMMQTKERGLAAHMVNEPTYQSKR